MQVTTNQEISYALRLTPTEARKLYFILHNIASSRAIIASSEKVMCRDLAKCLHDEIQHTEGTNL
jgi:hypothetical protein